MGVGLNEALGVRKACVGVGVNGIDVVSTVTGEFDTVHHLGIL